MPSNPANSLAQRVADAFNHHGSFAARATESNLAVEVRHLDTGELATLLWLPETDTATGWLWFPVLAAGLVTHEPRELSKTAGVDEVTRAVATSVLDERRA